MDTYEEVVLVKDRDGHCFFYGDEGHENWPKQIKKSKYHKEIRGLFINKQRVVTLWEFHCEVCIPTIYKLWRKICMIMK